MPWSLRRTVPDYTSIQKVDAVMRAVPVSAGDENKAVDPHDVTHKRHESVVNLDLQNKVSGSYDDENGVV